MTIQEAEDNGLLQDHILLTDSQDIISISVYLGMEKEFLTEEIGGIFVKVDNGDYTSVFGFQGFVPYNTKGLIRFK